MLGDFCPFLRFSHDWITSLSHIGEGNGNPLQCSCLENPRDRGSWWAAVYGITQSRTRLKWLSSNSSSSMMWNKLKRTRKEGFTHENHDKTARHRELDKGKVFKRAPTRGKDAAYLVARLPSCRDAGSSQCDVCGPEPNLFVFAMPPELAQVALRHPPPTSRAWCWRSDPASVSKGRFAHLELTPNGRGGKEAPLGRGVGGAGRCARARSGLCFAARLPTAPASLAGHPKPRISWR